MFYLELFALLLLLFFLYEKSNSLKYYMKFLTYYGGVIFNSFLLLPYFLLRPVNVLNLLWVKKKSIKSFVKIIPLLVELQANFVHPFRS